MNSQDEDDAQDDGADRSGHVVDDSSGPDTSRNGQIQGSDGRNHRWNDERQNEHLQHSQKQITWLMKRKDTWKIAS